MAFIPLGFPDGSGSKKYAHNAGDICSFLSSTVIWMNVYIQYVFKFLAFIKMYIARNNTLLLTVR